MQKNMCENHPSVGSEVYREIAREYVQVSEDKDIGKFYERPAMISLIPDLNGIQALDIGCGPGFYSEYLLKGGAKVTAMDYCEEFVEVTRRRLKGRGDFYCADASEGISFLEDRSMDLIVAGMTLHYVFDWRALFREFSRILKRDGIVVFSTHHPCFGRFGKNVSKYFNAALVRDTWGSGFSKRICVPYYRRPLTEIVASMTDEGFLLSRLLEPRPLEEMKHLDMEFYERLLKEPIFICVQGKKA